MSGICGQVWFIKNGVGDREGCLAITSALFLIASEKKIISQSQQTLSSDHGSGTIQWFPRIERVGWFVEIIAEPMQVRRASVPNRNAVGAGVFNIEVSRGSGSAEEGSFGIGTRSGTTRTGHIARPESAKKFQLFGVAENGPRQSPRPGAEGRITLL